MRSVRENPDGEENQKATRDNERYVAALKVADTYKAKQEKHNHINNSEDDACAICGEDLRHEIHFRICKACGCKIESNGCGCNPHDA